MLASMIKKRDEKRYSCVTVCNSQQIMHNAPYKTDNFRSTENRKLVNEKKTHGRKTWYSGNRGKETRTRSKRFIKYQSKMVFVRIRRLRLIQLHNVPYTILNSLIRGHLKRTVV